MKFDRYGCLIREKYEPEFHPGNIGDSCHETGKFAVLTLDNKVDLMVFKAKEAGFYRHPELPAQVAWGHPSHFSGDQFVPLVLGQLALNRPLSALGITGKEWRIPGTNTLMTPAAWCLIRGHYWFLNLFNFIQGIILKFPYRYNDQKKWFERTAESSVDYLNMIVIWQFLRQKGLTAWLGASREKCCDMVLMYYQTGTDPEPNSEWIVQNYLRVLR